MTQPLVYDVYRVYIYGENNRSCFHEGTWFVNPDNPDDSCAMDEVRQMNKKDYYVVAPENAEAAWALVAPDWE